MCRSSGMSGSQARVLQAFRPDAEDDRSAGVLLELRAGLDDFSVERQLLASDLGDELAVASLDGRLDEVHGG